MRMNYEKAVLASRDHLEQDDCSVIGAAIAMNRSYHWAWKEFDKLGRKHGKPTPLELSTKITIGVDSVSEGIKQGKIKLTYEEFGRKVTPRTLAKTLTKGRWVAITRRHMLAIVNGVVEDYTADRNHKVLMFWRVS